MPGSRDGTRIGTMRDGLKMPLPGMQLRVSA